MRLAPLSTLLAMTLVVIQLVLLAMPGVLKLLAIEVAANTTLDEMLSQKKSCVRSRRAA